MVSGILRCSYVSLCVLRWSYMVFCCLMWDLKVFVDLGGGS